MKSQFQQNSFFMHHQAGTLADFPYITRLSELPETTEPETSLSKLVGVFEDWSHRLEVASTEAGDARLLALESDLLDLRDEVTSRLHDLL